MAKERQRLTDAEAVAWEKKMREAGVTVTTPTTSTVTLLRKTPEDENARDADVGQ